MRAHLAANLVVTVTVLAWLASVSIAQKAPPAIQILLPFRVALEPCQILVRIRLQADAGDREVRVIAYDTTYDPPLPARTSTWTVEGEAAIPLTVLSWRLDAGEYSIVATVGSGLGVRARAIERLRVLPRF